MYENIKENMGLCEILPPNATVLREKCSPQNNAPVTGADYSSEHFTCLSWLSILGL